MMQLLREVEVVTRAYVRKGGKDNRRQQRARMLAFAEHAAASGVNSLGQLGKAHVILKTSVTPPRLHDQAANAVGQVVRWLQWCA